MTQQGASKKPLFGTLRGDPIMGAMPEAAGVEIASAGGGPHAATSDSDQFVIFQFSDAEEGQHVLEATSVEPDIEGSEEEPDAMVRLNMVGFHASRGSVSPDTKLTMRLDFGKDQQSESMLDTLFWSVAAGMDLFDSKTKEQAEPRRLNANIGEAWSRRPIEIPGGLGRLSFEVVEHKDPSWWRKVFHFLRERDGQRLTSVLGFPGITNEAVGFVDEMLNRLFGDDDRTLFRSREMTLALTKRAKSYISGGPHVLVGSLQQGYCLMARAGDMEHIVSMDPTVISPYGIIAPMASVEDIQRRGPSESDPFADLTYALFHVRIASARLTPPV